MKTRIERALQIASSLIIVGLGIELGTLLWFHPLALVFFVLLGGTAVVLGMVIYLVSLVFVVGSGKS